MSSFSVLVDESVLDGAFFVAARLFGIDRLCGLAPRAPSISSQGSFSLVPFAYDTDRWLSPADFLAVDAFLRGLEATRFGVSSFRLLEARGESFMPFNRIAGRHKVVDK